MAALVVQLTALFIVCFSVVWREHKSRQFHQRRSSFSSLRTAYGRRVAVRALLYALIFFNTYAWITIPNMQRLISNKPPKYWIVLIGNTLQPFQGFWNFFMYLHPRYSSVKQCYKDWPWWRVAWYAFQHGTDSLSDVSHRSSRFLSAGQSSHQKRDDETGDTSNKSGRDPCMRTESTRSTPETAIDGPETNKDIEKVGNNGDIAPLNRSSRRVSVSNPHNAEELAVALGGDVTIEHDTSRNRPTRRQSLPESFEISQDHVEMAIRAMLDE